MAPCARRNTGGSLESPPALDKFCQGLRDSFLLGAELPNPMGMLQQHIING